MLRRFRLHGSGGGPQGEGNKARHSERGGGLHHCRPGRPHRSRLSRDNKNGNVVTNLSNH